MTKRPAHRAAGKAVILVPLDGSRLGEAALEALAWVARPAESAVVLLRVVPPLKPAGLLRDEDTATHWAHE